MNPRIPINGLLDLSLPEKADRAPTHLVLAAKLGHVEYLDNISVAVPQKVSLRSCLANPFSCFLGVGLAVVGIFLAASVILNSAPLCVHVTHVVSSRAEEQVIGTNANRIVALMAHELAVGDGAKMQFPGSDVRRVLSTIIPPVDSPVSEPMRRSIPRPAPVRFCYPLPEAIREGAYFILSHSSKYRLNINLSSIDLT